VAGTWTDELAGIDLGEAVLEAGLKGSKEAACTIAPLPQSAKARITRAKEPTLDPAQRILALIWDSPAFAQYPLGHTLEHLFSPISERWETFADSIPT
jgi:hypothetical protein